MRIKGNLLAGEDGGWDIHCRAALLPLHSWLWASLWDLHQYLQELRARLSFLCLRRATTPPTKGRSPHMFLAIYRQRLTRRTTRPFSICSYAVLFGDARPWKMDAAKSLALQTETLYGLSTALLTDTARGISVRELIQRRHAPGSFLFNGLWRRPVQVLHSLSFGAGTHRPHPPFPHMSTYSTFATAPAIGIVASFSPSSLEKGTGQSPTRRVNHLRLRSSVSVDR